jgi:hypothetical protein
MPVKKPRLEKAELERFLEETVAHCIEEEPSSVNIILPLDTLLGCAENNRFVETVIAVEYLYLEETLKALHSIFIVSEYSTRIGFKLHSHFPARHHSNNWIFKISWKKNV